MSDLRWLTTPSPAQRAELHRLVSAVAGLGGAVGWLTVPDRGEVDAWFDGLAADVRFVTAYDDSDTLVAAGYWTRQGSTVTRHNAEIRKEMVHPEVRGRGLSRGRRPDWIAVGHERFDQVLLHLDLRHDRRPGTEPLVRHGGRREGPGAS